MTTAYILHPRHQAHRHANHPERPERVNAIADLFRSSEALPRLLSLTPQPADEEQLLRVHTRSYLDLLAQLTQRGQPGYFGTDTYFTPESYDIARLSAGASLRAVDAVLTGEADNALVAARPPGHHALPDAAMGFCLLANVALAARHAQDVHGVGRILIVDYDVHHGNGTQAIFYADPDVLYISTHQSPFYPGTGAVEETGVGAGRGATINVPLRAGYGDEAFAQVIEQVVWPAAWRFQPELILVSAGFDAHWADPLGGMTLTLSGYAHFSRELVRMAQALCDDRIIFVLEGGYNLQAVAHGMLNVAYALLDDDTVSDPLGLSDTARQRRRRLSPIAPLLARIREVHGLA